jgi:hypothetical protein
MGRNNSRDLRHKITAADDLRYAFKARLRK